MPNQYVDWTEALLQYPMGCTNKRAIKLRGIIKVEGPTDGDMACQSVTYVFVSREH